MKVNFHLCLYPYTLFISHTVFLNMMNWRPRARIHGSLHLSCRDQQTSALPQPGLTLQLVRLQTAVHVDLTQHEAVLKEASSRGGPPSLGWALHGSRSSLPHCACQPARSAVQWECPQKRFVLVQLHSPSHQQGIWHLSVS